MYIDSTSLSSPMDMETDGPFIEDVMMLKKTVEEEATQVKDVLPFKGIVHPKMKKWCLSAYPQGIQYVGDFVSSVEHKQRFLTQTVAVCQSYNGSQCDSRLWEKTKHTQTKPN